MVRGPGSPLDGLEVQGFGDLRLRETSSKTVQDLTNATCQCRNERNLILGRQLETMRQFELRFTLS